MLTHSTISESATGESWGANVLTGAVILGSALMLYAALAVPQRQPAAQAAAAVPAIEQVVVTAPAHVS